MKMSGESPISARDSWFVGEDQTIQWTIYDLDPLTETNPPTPKNISSWTIQYRMAPTPSGSSSLTKSASLTDPTNGVASVAFGAADTTGLTPQTYHYTLARTDSGFNQVLAYGTAVLKARVV